MEGPPGLGGIGMEKRTDAGGWMHERAELEGRTVWGTGAPVDHGTVPKGLYCYDIFGSGKQMDAENNYISQTPVAENCVGAIISMEPLPFHGGKALCLDGIKFREDEPMCSLGDLMGQAQQTACPQEMAGMCM